MKLKIIAVTIILIIILGSFGSVGLQLDKTEAINNSSLLSKGYALCVGVNNGLSYCDDDAESMRRVLTENGWINVEKVTDVGASVTKNAIISKLNNMASQSTASSVSFFSFSGHGTESGGQAAICLSNGEYLWANELSPILDEFNGRIVCVFDSCHAGGMGGSPPTTGEDTFDAVEFVTNFLSTVGAGSENRVLLMACAISETTSELSELKAGVWTYFIHEGLTGSADSNGDGIITAEETFYYAKPKAMDYADVNPEMYDGDTNSQVDVIGESIESNLHVTVTLLNIIKQDDVEPLSITGADWYYTIRIFSEDVRYISTKYGPDNKDNWSPNQGHEVAVIDSVVNIEIKLMENDAVLDDLADISSRSGGGTDQFQLTEWYSGENENAIYHGTYDIKTKALTGDIAADPEGDKIYIITGESDSASGDQNDAKIEIKVEDDYNLEADGGDSYSGAKDVNINFKGGATGGVPPYSYIWNFGDGATGTGQNTLHKYANAGTYHATLTVTDAWNANAVDNDITVTITENSKPNKPDISGPTSGIGGKTYQYKFKVTDPNNGDLLDLEIDWGDGSSKTITDLAEGTEETVSHAFPEVNNPFGKSFTIKARCTDSSGNTGDWGYLDVSMPKNKAMSAQFMRLVLEKIPILIKFFSFHLI
jgi:hypothetical protein